MSISTKAATKIKESDLYEPVKAWLEERGWDVYPEVQREQYGKRADVVGLSCPAIAVVEMKTSLSMNLIEQALHWKFYAHYVYIAIPNRKSNNMFAFDLLKKEGIGILQVDRRDWGGWNDKAHCIYNSARYNRVHKRYSEEWYKVCTPDHKEGIPGGSAGGNYVTAYSLTIKRVMEELERHPEGMTIKQILDDCETHYQNPKPSLSNALRNFESTWCYSEKRGNKLYFVHRKHLDGVLDLNVCSECEQRKHGWGTSSNLQHCKLGKFNDCEKIKTGKVEGDQDE